MQDNLEICNLLDIIIEQKKPDEIYSDYAEAWNQREMIEKFVMKNSPGTKDHLQIRHTKTTANVCVIISCIYPSC